MGISKIARSKESFNEKITNLNQATKDSIVISINNFENFSMEKYGISDIISELKKSSEEEIFDVLQNWINWNDDKAPSTLKTYFSHLRKYLHYRGIKLNDQDVKNELIFKHKVEEELYGLTLLDAQKILSQMRYHHRVQYMCQLSSLMRIGEIIQLKKRDLITGQKNIIVKIPSTIAKFNKSRTTFFSKEASRLLIPILRKIEDDDLVFGSSNNKENTDYQNKVNSFSATKQVLRYATKRAGLDMKYDSTGRYMINTHSFRAFGITKLSRHDPNFAKKIAGQKGYLLQYDRMTDEEKLDLYEKYEHELTIDDSQKQNEKIKQLEAEKEEWKKELDDKQAEYIKDLKAEIIAELSNPNRITPSNLLDSNKDMVKQSKRLKKKHGLD